MIKRLAVPGCILLVYLASFFLPAVTCVQHSHMSPGPSGVLWGWQAFCYGPLLLFSLIPCWLANPFLWCGVTLWNARPRAAEIFGIAAALLTATTLFLYPKEVQTFEAGFFVWLLSMLLLAAVRSLGEMWMMVSNKAIKMASTYCPRLARRITFHFA